MTQRLSFVIILLLFSTTSQASSTIRLEPGIGQYNMALYADILEDKHGILSIDQVSSNVYDDKWTQNQHSPINFAFSHSVYWVRYTITSEMKISKNWLLEVSFALNDYIDYYLLNDRKILSVIKTGDRLPFNTRPIEYRNFLFKFDISPNEIKHIYLRFQSHDGLHEPSPIILWDQQSFALSNGLRNLGLGLYFGIMLAMVIYNLFIFLSVRDRVYAYYVMYIFGVIFWLAAYFGLTFQYLWPNSPDWGNQMILVSTSFWAGFMIQFIRSFLDTKRQAPWFDKLSIYALVGLLFNLILSFTGKYAIGIQILVILGLIMCIASIVVGVVCFRAGFRSARYFLLAWTTLLLSICIFVLKIAGVLPAIFVVEKSIQIGSIIEVMLLSLGLADRINELKKEKLLAQAGAIRSIESSLKLKTDFITSISHELRTPMNAIIGGLEVVQKHPLEQLKTPLDIVQGGASDMMNLVNDILTHTEIQSDRLIIQSNHIDIRNLLKSLRQPYQYLCDDRNLQLHWQIDSALPRWICTDEEKLVTILSKLLENAIKFTEEGLIKVDIKSNLSTSPWQFICSVTDTGIGIEQEKQSSIFESFTQLECGLQRRYGGLGIGLSICKKLTKILGGELNLESIAGQGSIFSVIIPIEPGIKPVVEENKNLASANLPILVVEDNVVNQKVMMKLLEKIGYKSVIANHGEEALEILKKESVSLILMDLQMPVMDGLTCTAEIRKQKDRQKNIPIIAVTANLMDADKELCIKSGMNDFLKKPIKPESLRKSLLCYLEPGLETAVPEA